VFTTLIAATAAVLALSMAHAWQATRDPFHPMLVLGGLLAFMYVLMPGYLHLTDPGGLRWHVGDDQLVHVQLINLLGAGAICLGVLAGAAPGSRPSGHLWQPTPELARMLLVAGWALGLLGLAAFAYTIAHVGGLGAAYGRPYGGGWAETGYVRDAAKLTLPALLFIMIAHTGRRPSWPLLAAAVVLASPFWIHGLLGARRGPTFVAATGLVVGWYLVRHRRPPAALAALGALLLGALVLLLVANRGDIHLGADLALERGPLSAIGAGPGNEYIAASALILDAEHRQAFSWGARYVVVLLVRPIPRQIWPTKYADAAALLGIHDIEAGNIGMAGDRFIEVLGWRLPMGVAPGIIADMWLELWWLAIGAVLALGWLYGRSWANTHRRGRFWIPLYAILVAHSAFLVTQSLQAWIVPMLVTGVPAWLCWRAAEHGAGRRGLWVPAAGPEPEPVPAPLGHRRASGRLAGLRIHARRPPA
jgi:hypothetical protein